MTLRVEDIEPGALRLAFSNWRGRAVGYDVSAYLVDGVLVDTGFPRIAHQLVAALAAHTPRGAIVTHWHEDHAGNAARLVGLGIPVMMHPECEAELRARPKIRLYRESVWGRNPPLNLPLRGFDASPLQMIPTPGHTSDHLAVWHPERRILVSGDLFLGVKVRVAHPEESPSDTIRSLKAVGALEPRLLLDAHRGVVPNPVPLITAKINWMEETIGKIEQLASEGSSEREIRRRVLGREPLVGWVSRGEYSRLALVRTVLRERDATR